MMSLANIVAEINLWFYLKKVFFLLWNKWVGQDVELYFIRFKVSTVFKLIFKRSKQTDMRFDAHHLVAYLLSRFSVSVLL